MFPSPTARGSIDTKSDLARCKRVFVYGTLLSSVTTQIAHRFQREALFIGKGKVPGQLYAIASYPGLRDESTLDRSVLGEVYEVDSGSTLDALDEYEGYDPQQSSREFERVLSTATLDSGLEVQVWIYRYVGDVSGKRLIESGDYSTDSLFSSEAQRVRPDG